MSTKKPYTFHHGISEYIDQKAAKAKEILNSKDREIASLRSSLTSTRDALHNLSSNIAKLKATESAGVINRATVNLLQEKLDLALAENLDLRKQLRRGKHKPSLISSIFCWSKEKSTVVSIEDNPLAQ